MNQEYEILKAADEIWPLTVVADRYGGAYSGGKYIAWNCYPWEVPGDSFGDDCSCADFWMFERMAGRGCTPMEAIGDLVRKLEG